MQALCLYTDVNMFPCRQVFDASLDAAMVVSRMYVVFIHWLAFNVWKSPRIVVAAVGLHWRRLSGMRGM